MVNGLGLPSSRVQPRGGDEQPPGYPMWTYLFTCASQHCCNSKRFFFLKKWSPYLQRSLSHSVFFRPQTDDLTVKNKGQRRYRIQATGQRIPLPSGVKPFDCVFQKRQNRKHLTHSQSCASHHKQVLDGWIQRRLDGSQDSAQQAAPQLP